MSRIGKEPIKLPKEVKAKLENRTLFVESSKGKLTLLLPGEVNVALENDTVTVQRKDDEKLSKSLHGTMRALIANMVTGVTQGFRKELAIVGIGYKSQMKGNTLVLNIGFSHPVEMPVPKDLKVTVPKPTSIIIEGIDKQKVGEFAARVRKHYPPEPYKGKGIRYAAEEVKKKLGKALAK